MFKVVLTLNCVLSLLYPIAASAWGYQGHKVVGSIADQLLKPSARQQVRREFWIRFAHGGPLGRLRAERGPASRREL